MKHLLFASASFMAISAITNHAAAQEVDSDRRLEAVTVTANKRTENAQDIPQSLSVITSSELKLIGAQDFSDLANLTPGVELRNSQAGRGAVAIRGVSELNTANLAGGTGSSVGFYLDELPLAMAGYMPDIKSFDVERVEILKGPQGTLYGEGSLSGTIRLITNTPDTEGFAGAIDLTASTVEDGDSNHSINGMVNIPILKDKLALRIVGFDQKAGGFIDTTDAAGNPVSEDANYNETTGGRASLLWTPTDRFELSATAFTTSADRGAPSIAKANKELSESVSTETSDDIDAYNLTGKYEFGFADLISSSSYFEREALGVVDQGGLVPQVNFVFGLFGVPITVDGVYIDQWLETEAFAQEVRLVSSNGGPLDWTVGAFYKKHDSRLGFNSDGEPGIPSSVWEGLSQALTGGAVTIPDGFSTDTTTQTEQIAVFGEGTYSFNEKVDLLLGGRLFREKRDSTSSFSGVFPVLLGGPLPGTFSSKAEDDIFNPKATLTYHWNDDILSYGTVSRGFRSGGQNDLAVFVPGSPIEYDPEQLTNYEVGFKSTLADGAIRLNGAIFYMEWEDLQSVIAEGPGGIGEVIGNIGSAHSQGIEAQLTAQLTQNLLFNLSGALIEAETDEATLVPDPSGGAAITVPSGTRIPNVSESSFAASLDYNFSITESLDGFARASWSYVGGSTNNVVRNQKVPEYNLVDLKLGIEKDTWTLSVFANNVLDEDVLLSRAVTDNLADGEPRYNWGRPRTFGINLAVDF